MLSRKRFKLPGHKKHKDIYNVDPALAHGALTQRRRLQPPSKANKNHLPSSVAPSAVSHINLLTMSKSAASDRHAIN